MKRLKFYEGTLIVTVNNKTEKIFIQTKRKKGTRHFLKAIFDALHDASIALESAGAFCCMCDITYEGAKTDEVSLFFSKLDKWYREKRQNITRGLAP